VDLMPQDARALNNLGYALSLDGRDEHAAAALRRAVALDPNHMMARANLAMVEQRLALRLSNELTDGASPAAEAKLKPEQPGPADDVPDKVMAMLRDGSTSIAPASPASAPLAVQSTPNVAPLLVLTAEADPPPAPRAAAKAPTSTTHAPRIFIVNGVGVGGAATRVRQLLREDGLATARLQNQRPYQQATTVVQYRPGLAEVAMRVAQRIPAGAALQETATMDPSSDVRVVLGHDRKAPLAACVKRNECGGPEPAHAAAASTITGLAR
jgi:hypothetical protein